MTLLTILHWSHNDLMTKTYLRQLLECQPIIARLFGTRAGVRTHVARHSRDSIAISTRHSHDARTMILRTFITKCRSI